MAAIKHWEQLTNMLNSDGSGDTKFTDKWKKVWSDFKNNTKKKAARLHRAATGTGGGPAVFSKLSNLEERVLKIIRVQAATGLALEEAGFSQEVHIEPTVSEAPIIIQSSQLDDSIELWNQPGPSNQPHVAPISTSPHFHVEDEEFIEGGEDLTQPSLSQAHVAAPTAEVQPALSGQTLNRESPQRGITASPRRLGRGSPRRMRGLPRRPIRPARTEEAAQQFLHSDTEWREFRMQQHRDKMETRREENRIREMQVQSQREWLRIKIIRYNGQVSF